MQNSSISLQNLPYIQDLEFGLLEEGYFLIKKIQLNVGKKNIPFLRLLLSDKTGHLPAIYFGNSNELKKLQAMFKEGDVAKISGIIEEFQEILQIKLLKLEKPSRQEFETSRFWRRTPHDRRMLYRELKEKISLIQTTELKKLCLSVIKDKEFMKLFLEAPASRYVHHAYIGGLLEHTLNVVKICESFAKIYPQADCDLLLCGAFLHDIGKVDEYEFLFEYDHSLEGKLKGHTVLGYDRLRPYLDRVNISAKLRLKIEHMLLAHQGKRSWGAIEEPKFLEAHLIHAADSTDSAQFIFSNAKKGMLQRKTDNNDFVSYLGRDIYIG